MKEGFERVQDEVKEIMRIQDHHEGEINSLKQVIMMKSFVVTGFPPACDAGKDAFPIMEAFVKQLKITVTKEDFKKLHGPAQEQIGIAHSWRVLFEEEARWSFRKVQNDEARKQANFGWTSPE